MVQNFPQNGCDMSDAAIDLAVSKAALVLSEKMKEGLKKKRHEHGHSAQAPVQTDESVATRRRNSVGVADGREHNKIGDFRGNIIKNAGSYIATFCGKYENMWINDVTGKDVCTACVFFPPGSDLAGKHVKKEDGSGKCRCFELYDEPKPWGCFWFTGWVQVNVINRCEHSRSYLPCAERERASGAGPESNRRLLCAEHNYCHCFFP